MDILIGNGYSENMIPRIIKNRGKKVNIFTIEKFLQLNSFLQLFFTIEK